MQLPLCNECGEPLSTAFLRGYFVCKQHSERGVLCLYEDGKPSTRVWDHFFGVGD